jgi:hypothetical protein
MMPDLSPRTQTYYDNLTQLELQQAVDRINSMHARFLLDAWLKLQRARQGSE